jgi:hypothetical protein
VIWTWKLDLLFLHVLGLLLFVQRASLPPSVASDAPVMKEALSDARKRIAAATSSGWPMRFMSTPEVKAVLFSRVPVKRFNRRFRWVRARRR